MIWPPQLTRRQREVAQRLVLGESNKEISAALVMSESTVKQHLKKLFRKLETTNRTRAAVLIDRAARSA